jgi:hypothetical protein
VRIILNKSFDIKCFDSENKEIKMYDSVYFVNKKSKIEKGIVFALLRDNKVLIETSEKGNYEFKNSDEIGKIIYFEKNTENEGDKKIENETEKKSKQVKGIEETNTSKEEDVIEEDKFDKLENWLKNNYQTTELVQKEIGKKFGVKRYEVANTVRKLGLKKKEFLN